MFLLDKMLSPSLRLNLRDLSQRKIRLRHQQRMRSSLLKNKLRSSLRNLLSRKWMLSQLLSKRLVHKSMRCQSLILNGER